MYVFTGLIVSLLVICTGDNSAVMVTGYPSSVASIEFAADFFEDSQ